MITRKPKLRRQRKIFRQQGKMPRPDEMKINVATWGRLLKRNKNFNFSQKSVDNSGGSAQAMAAAAAAASAANNNSSGGGGPQQTAGAAAAMPPAGSRILESGSATGKQRRH